MPRDPIQRSLHHHRRRQKMPGWYQPGWAEPLPSEAPNSEFASDSSGFAQSGQRTPVSAAKSADMMRPLPRRKIETPQFSMSPLMMQTEEHFEASLVRTLSRFLAWILGFFRFQAAVMWDKIRGRDSQQRRAERLLRTISRIGGTLIKVGQQLAMRVDLLPYAYCVELSKLLDRMPEMSLKDAVAAIERATGKKLKEVFARFDPEPIGSASIACVYRAVLLTGEQVAVKVRRPKIGQIFAADLRALAWMIGLLEWFAIIRPGNLGKVVSELEISFMEELDLRREAYCQEVFRRNTQSRKLTEHFYFSAPRVFFELTNREVMVEDYVSGIWLWEILAAVEQGNETILARMRELNIDPKVVARRIMWISVWGNLSNVMFHADPHPANVIVQANSHIIFIDFGACGYATREQRNRFAEFFRCQAIKDVSGMVKASMALLEPLPRIDLDEFRKDLERQYFRIMSAVWSKKARWWERTGATMWLSLMQVTQKYNLPVNSDTVKGLRATLLYDTLAVRLDHDMNVSKECERFMRDSMRLTGRRTRRTLRKRMQSGLQLEDYAKLHELARLGGNALEQLKRFVDNPPFNFHYSIEKPVYAVITLINVTAFLTTILAGISAVIMGYQTVTGKHVAIGHVLQLVLSHRSFQGVVCVAILVGIRRIMFRLKDRDVD